VCEDSRSNLSLQQQEQQELCRGSRSSRSGLSLQRQEQQVREPRMPRALTTEEQAALAQSVARRQLWCSLAESTARLDLEELEEWMGEEDEETEGQEGDPTSME
jgi:hypothetical protein